MSTATGFMIKWKAFFIIFNGLSLMPVKQNFVGRLESNLNEKKSGLGN